MKTISIITINTWKCDGNYDRRLILLSAQLKALQADVIACQECFVSEEAGSDTLQFLAKELAMQAFFLPARFRKRIFRGNWVNSFSGLGILSRCPLTPLQSYTLPEVTGDDERKLQLAEITLPGSRNLLIANTHLTHLRNVEMRCQQAAFVADLTSSFSDYNYRVICGDMNATPDSREIKMIKSKAAAIDCYAAGKGAEPRHSLAEAYDRSIMACVDHIFALPFPSSDSYPKFVNSAIVLNSKDENGIYPSDHFGIGTMLVID